MIIKKLMLVLREQYVGRGSMQTTVFHGGAGSFKTASQAQMLRPRVYRLATTEAVAPLESPSVPQEVGSSAPEHPVRRSEPVEHPQPLSTTYGADGPASDVVDPTRE